MEYERGEAQARGVGPSTARPKDLDDSMGLNSTNKNNDKGKGCLLGSLAEHSRACLEHEDWEGHAEAAFWLPAVTKGKGKGKYKGSPKRDSKGYGG